MHLLYTTCGHDIFNNRRRLARIHAHNMQFIWPVFRVKHVLASVSYIVFPIVLMHISAHFCINIVATAYYT